MKIQSSTASGSYNRSIVPNNAIQYFFVEDLTEATGNGSSPIISGSATHQFAVAGEFTGADGTNGNDGLGLIAGDTLTDNILRSDNLAKDDTILMFGNLFLSKAPVVDETLFSFGSAAGNGGYYEMQLLASGSLQFDFDNGVTRHSLSFGSSIYGFGVWFPFMVAIYGDTNSFDFFVTLKYDGDVAGSKTRKFSGGVVPDAVRGLSLMGRYVFGNKSKYFGEDATSGRIAKCKGLSFARLSKYTNAPNILRESNETPHKFLRSLYDATN